MSDHIGHRIERGLDDRRLLWSTGQGQRLTIIIIIIILFESGNMAHTQTHKDIQTDKISKKNVQ